MSQAFWLQIDTHMPLPWETLVAPVEQFFGERIAKVLAYPGADGHPGPRNYLSLVMASEYEIKQVRLVDYHIRNTVCSYFEQIGIPFGLSGDTVRTALKIGWWVGDEGRLKRAKPLPGIHLNSLMDPYQSVRPSFPSGRETIFDVLSDYHHPNPHRCFGYYRADWDRIDLDIQRHLGLRVSPFDTPLELLPASCFRQPVP